jgi:putative membrane protein
MVMNLTDADHDAVSAAIASAERASDGEIVAIAGDLSDSYHDVGVHYAVLAMALVLALCAAAPQCLVSWFELLSGGWSAEPSLRQLLSLEAALAVLAFLVVLGAMRWRPLRLALTRGRPRRGGCGGARSNCSRPGPSGARSAAPGC